MPLDNAGNKVSVLLSVPQAFVLKGATNVDGAKDFLTYLIKPANLDNYLKQAKARWLPVMPSLVKTDSYWLDPQDPTRVAAITQGVLGPTAVWPSVYNPAWGQVDNEHLWGVAEADVINGMKPEDAVEKGLKRMQTLFAKYPIS